jgi:hydroxymethylpyrimidine/phosphomethylpyrimidine kinase
VQRVVLDPVMVATSGDRLIAPETVQVLVDELFPLATVITPNLDEAALLLGRPIGHAEELEGAARELLAMGARAVLLKGGHLPGDEVTDLLVTGTGVAQRLSSSRIESRNTHGTGCTLSSAIAAHLAQGEPLERAVSLARAFILQAIAQGADVHTGAGHGPLNHGHAPVAQKKQARG